jgi:hypothetical protein
VIIRSLGSLLCEVQTVLDRVFPGCEYRGPERCFREGALAKYGILDLRYNPPDPPDQLAVAEAHRGLSLLRDLRLLESPEDWIENVREDDGVFDVWDDLAKDTERNEAILMVFMEDQADRPPADDRMKWLKDPSLFPFQFGFRVVVQAFLPVMPWWVAQERANGTLSPSSLQQTKVSGTVIDEPRCSLVGVAAWDVREEPSSEGWYTTC